MALPFYIKKYLKAKEELWKNSKIHFTMQKYNLIFKKKKSSKRNPKGFQDIIITLYNLISPSFNTSQKISSFQKKSSYKNRPIIIIIIIIIYYYDYLGGPKIP